MKNPMSSGFKTCESNQAMLPRGVIEEANHWFFKGKYWQICKSDWVLETTVDKVLELLDGMYWEEDQPRCPHARFLQNYTRS